VIRIITKIYLAVASHSVLPASQKHSVETHPRPCRVVLLADKPNRQRQSLAEI